MKKIFISFCLLLFLLCSSSFALEKLTHERLNEVIAPQINQSLVRLGFPQGVEAFVNGKKIIRWIKEGGIKEDEPIYTRSMNHFHNPLKKPWSSAGLKGTFQSSVIWAQDQRVFGSLWGGDFSWKAVREYFYIALTGRDFSGNLMALTQEYKEMYFGKTFRGIGQIMHLVQDVSVPAHTRNDAHVIGYHYELAVDKFRTKGDPVFTDALASPITFDPVILTFDPNTLAPIPIAKIFDTDKYKPESPDPTVTVGNTIGLAEYTNANFVSEDLISANFQDFPYPRIQDTTTIGKSITSPSGTYTRQYYFKNCCGETNAGQGYLLSAVDLLDYWRQKHPLLSAGLPKIPGLDDNVYKDYAALLIPRAVGYSAGLLDYFFRGTLEVISAPGGIKVKNINTETMSSYTDSSTGNTIGSIEIYYDDTSNIRRLLATYTLSSPLAPGQETPVITFTAPSGNIAPGKYIIVFRGKLGSEEGAVIGKVVMQQIYYVSTRDGLDKIYRMETDGSNPTVVFDNQDPGLYLGKIALSPDGKVLVFASERSVTDPLDSTIYKLDLTNNTLSFLTMGDWPNWSPDGRKIVFQRESGLYLPNIDTEIYTIDIATGAVTQLTNEPSTSYSGEPSWSPDGSMIAYTRFNEPQEPNCANLYVIYLMDSSGNPIVSVTCQTEGPYVDTAPSWSPDGQEIALTRQKYVDRSYQLYKVNLATKTITKLTDSPDTGYDEYAPDWSPDGKTIAISSQRDGDFDIWLVEPNGGGYITNLTDSNPEWDGLPSFVWTP